ncbi:hypothetical protein RKE29_13555 [Streptomyces sp. B1866]|uniref:hypothetical protein n=1 Tax=Streptomyces sp. B1866 TaxID=3075431 RepID=UPI00289158C4|nr:hypothetical protein [Streptomyces sp. B1866]MDT3397664.1 hypothetical protein [Streptomyces sp. B1866]
MTDYCTLERAAAREGAAGELLGLAAAMLAAVAAGRSPVRAVRHPLGFFCLPVLRDGHGRGACVHVFGSRAAAVTTSGLHCHSWELTSCVLYGQVGNVRLEVRDAGRADPSPPDPASADPASADPASADPVSADPVSGGQTSAGQTSAVTSPESGAPGAYGPTHRVFEVRSRPFGVDEIQPTPRLVRCEAGPVQTSRRGEIYTLPAGEFHFTDVPEGAAAATLVLGRSVPDRTDLSLGPVHGTGHRVVRRQCDSPLTARIAGSALRRVHDPSSGTS